MCSDVSAHRIQNNVSGNLQQLTLLLDEDSLEPALEDMSQPLVGSVERLCIHTIQVAHATREIRIRRFDQQVIVIAHKAIGMADPSEALNDIPYNLKEQSSVIIGEEDAARERVLQELQGTRGNDEFPALLPRDVT
jgi:hypothetical protein